MNKTINKFLLTETKFMSKLHLKQPGFTYSVCGPFTKHCERIKKIREIDNLKHLYRNELDKACFAHDQQILIVKIYQRGLFQIGFSKIEPIKLLEIVNMMCIKERQQIWYITFLIRRQDRE